MDVVWFPPDREEDSFDERGGGKTGGWLLLGVLSGKINGTGMFLPTFYIQNGPYRMEHHLKFEILNVKRSNSKYTHIHTYYIYVYVFYIFIYFSPQFSLHVVSLWIRWILYHLWSRLGSALPDDPVAVVAVAVPQAQESVLSEWCGIVKMGLNNGEASRNPWDFRILQTNSPN